MPLPLDLWYYSQGKHAPIYQPLTQGTGRRWCSCVIPFKLMDGWGCSLLKQPPSWWGPKGTRPRTQGSQTSGPLISDPSRPHPVALPGNSENVSWKKLDPSLVIPRRGLLLLTTWSQTWLFASHLCHFQKYQFRDLSSKESDRNWFGVGPGHGFWKTLTRFQCVTRSENHFSTSQCFTEVKKKHCRPLLPLFPVPSDTRVTSLRQEKNGERPLIHPWK